MSMRRRCAGTAFALVVAGLPAATSVSAAPATAAAANIAVPAPEWDALFDRRSGWTGADGIYSIPLSGDERPGSDTTTFFTFSDTFIGQVNAADQRLAGSTLVNNTMALLAGRQPDPANIDFYWQTTAGGAPRAQVVPSGPGRRLNRYSVPLTIFNFAVDGVSLLASAADSVPPFSRYRQADAPLYLPKNGSMGDTTYGLAVMPNTPAAGAPAPDGFVYVYGVRNDFSKKLLVARVRPGAFANFAAYRFWTGSAWSPSITAAVPVASRVSSEFSVSPLPDGRYILVFQLDTLSDKVAVRYGDSPVGRGATTQWCGKRRRTTSRRTRTPTTPRRTRTCRRRTGCWSATT